MSGFDDKSPFGDPFNDPSITQVTSNQNKPSGLEDYNPFANQTTKPANPVRGASNPPSIPPPPSNFSQQNEPAVLPTSIGSAGDLQRNEPPPAYTQTATQNISQAELLRRQEELERKAAELAAREEALRNAQFNVREPNWPPLPVGPCFYQDINVEIPPEFQKIVRLAYYLWMSYILVLIANFFGGIAILSVESDSDVFGFSIMSLIFFVPLSFLCWFRPLYKAFRSDSSFNFMVFFFVFFCQIVLAVIWAIGLPSTGACGLIVAFKSIGKGVFYSLFLFIVAFILIGYAVASVLVLIKVHSIYRSTGASFAKAQAEFAQGVMRNEHIQQAATAAAAGAARQAMSQAFTNPNNPNAGSGLRY